MSVQFGRWNIDGRPADPGYLQKAKDMLAPYGPDGEGIYIKDGVGILYRAFHTTKESRDESQPLVTPSGSVICWDGRLDNREDLVRELGEPLTSRATDVDIVAAAYEAKGTGCFAKLIGDWALSVWDPKSRFLILAKDHVGTRHLYYSGDKDRIAWSTVLAPLVVVANKTFQLEEEYIAGWFSSFPATHLTPYTGVHAVPPSSFVLLNPRPQTTKYWDFDPNKRTLYHADTEYEQQFRHLFAQAVRRRLRSDRPVLAELSGGMDSSSIVCMGDEILSRADAEAPRLDTLSYYDDSEPNWNERPYFSIVEKKRGRSGLHINVDSSELPLDVDFAGPGFPATPGSIVCRSKTQLEFSAGLNSQAIRVVLSGIGGDEIAGGVPTAMPEIEDLVATMRVGTLARELKAWALNTRKPWFHLLLQAASGFLPAMVRGTPKYKQPAAWLCPRFVRRNRSALNAYETRLEIFGPLPSFQENVIALNALRRQLSCELLPSDPCYEKRYPYLDRDLMSFMYAIPREQVVRPGHRRSLMRRALVGIVPHEVLHRRRKAFVSRRPRLLLSHCTDLLASSDHMISASAGIINPHLFLASIQKAPQDPEIQILSIMRTILIEVWLRAASRHSTLEFGRVPTCRRTNRRAATLISAEKN